MNIRSIFVYTHDSIGLGEDGPTHQPIEHLSSLRIMPNLSVWRPCDTVETAAAWQAALERQGPSCLLFSRQNLPFQERSPQAISNIKRGGYTLLECAEDHQPDAILIATGSEVSLAVEAAKLLKDQEIYVRVVSMPATDVFLKQDLAYRQEVLPDSVPARVVVEAGVSDFWYQFVGAQGRVIGVDRFGASAPAKDVYRDCGLTIEQIVAITKEVIYSVATTEHHFRARCASGEVS